MADTKNPLDYEDGTTRRYAELVTEFKKDGTVTLHRRETLSEPAQRWFHHIQGQDAEIVTHPC